MGFLVTLVCLAGAADFNARLDAFPIGFWNYASIEVFDEAKIQEWADAGITLTMGPEYAATPENVARMRQILDWSNQRGIKVIVCDPRTRSRTPLPADFAQRAAEAARDFADHPALFGFHILDEPGKEDFQACCDAVRVVKQAAPETSPFVNLLPWHMGAGARVGYDDWGVYLDDFVKQSGVEFLCYDCYSQMNPGKSGWGMYFRNLREYGAAAKRADIPFWTTILSVGHFNYRCPSEDDIRWQFNTAVAHGAQGILYFFFYMRAPHENYRLSPVDEFWDRTPVFESLKRTNRGFTKRYGRLFLDLQLVKAMQYPEAPEGCDLFAPDDVVAQVDSSCPLLISRFADPQGRPWIAVVNNTVDTNTLARISFRGANSIAFQMSWENKETAAALRKEEASATASHWLAPGQMEVYRVDVKE